jgi:PKD repeat protein
MPDGSSSTEATPTFTFPQSGVYGICLTITSDNGNCTSTVCDTIAVDDMGMVSNDPIWFDCTGVLWGPNTSGTPCTTFLGEQGTWSDNCVCIADPSTGCQAGFWTIQAYDSTADGGVEPIPNEVWVWNLSSGGNGSYQFTWDFGDGDTSSDAYPIHEYDGPGPWLLCLTMYSGGCTDTYCDSVSVDENGILNGMTIENGGHPGTSNMAGRSNGFTLNVMHSSPTGISELPAIANLHVWPNPARNELNLTFSNTIAGTVPVTVIDPSGRVVIAEDHALTPGSNTLRLNIGPLGPGLYMVRIGNDARNARHRFMKVR